MLEGATGAVVGLYKEGEQVCLNCAVRRFGELPTNRVIVGLSDHIDGWNRYMGWQAQDDAEDNGYECECKDSDDDTLCSLCDAVFCNDCGKRLDP